MPASDPGPTWRVRVVGGDRVSRFGWPAVAVAVAAAVAVPVAVLAASVFHFGELTIGEVKAALREDGITVR